MKIAGHDSTTKAAARGFRASATTAAAASLAVALALSPDIAPATAELTDSAILGKLQLWVAADDAAHVATGPAGKLCWFDKRETSTSAPTHVYAESAGTSDPEVVTVTTNGQTRAAMYFGAYGSKRYMAWKKPGGATIPITDYAIRHVFAVYAMDDVSFGCIFGSVGAKLVSSSFLYGLHWPADNKSGTYFCNTESRSIIWNGKAWLDGRRFDGHRETPADGYYRHWFHLYEAEPSPWKGGAANAFFAWRDESETPSGAGYLCEALVFTNALTEVERVAVEDYLMDRWSLGTRDKVVNVADGETRTIDASAGDVVEDRLRFAGSGTVRKTGSGTFTYASANPQDFHGALRIDAGAVNLVTPLPIAASAGDRLTAAVGAGRMVTRTADAGAGTIVKDGAGELTLAEIPANLAKLDVRAGTLTVRRPPVNVGRVLGTPVSVSIPNASFEEIVGDSAVVNGCKTIASGDGLFHGWRGNAAWFFYWPTWKDNASSQSGNVKGSVFLGNVAPPDGNCALFFRWGSAYAETDVTIPSAGVYALSLEALWPSAWNYLGAQCSVKLLDAGGAVVADFGCAKYENSRQYLEKTLVATIAEPGTYRLRLANGSLAVVVDNLRLAKVAEIDDTVFPIPNGDFEAAAMLTGANAAVITNENSCAGWTLGLDGGTIAAANPEVALTTRIMVNTHNGYDAYNGAGGYYNDSRAPAGGYVELLFRGAGATAATTFTAPAGTHYLRCAAAFLFASSSTVEATVTAGGSTVSLGSLAPDNKLMRDRCFPVPFTLAAETEVTLTLRCTDGATNNSKGTVLDDFALVPFNDGGVGDNLVANGDFEDDSAHSSAWRSAAGSPWVSRKYSASASTFGSDPSDGAGFLSLSGGTAAIQDIAFPEAGRYRLRFLHRDWAAYNPPIATYAYLASGGVTNALCRFGATGALYTAHVEDIADFDIPAAGTYGIGFAGSGSGQVIIDDVEVRRISDRFDDTAAVMPQNMELDVAADAHVVLDFRGVQKIGDLKLGGRSVDGLVSSATHPEFFSGSGILEIKPKATVILMR